MKLPYWTKCNHCGNLLTVDIDDWRCPECKNIVRIEAGKLFDYDEGLVLQRLRKLRDLK